jgi:hypothetical protein
VALSKVMKVRPADISPWIETKLLVHQLMARCGGTVSKTFHNSHNAHEVRLLPP